MLFAFMLAHQVELTIHSLIANRNNRLIGVAVVPIYRAVPIGKLNDNLGRKKGVAVQAFDGALCQKFASVSL